MAASVAVAVVVVDDETDERAEEEMGTEDEIRAVFEKYGKGGIWGVIHVAVCSSLFPTLMTQPNG